MTGTLESWLRYRCQLTHPETSMGGSLGCSQQNLQPSPSARPVIRVDLTLMLLHNTRSHSQAQTRAPRIQTARHKCIKDRRQNIFGNALTVVLHNGADPPLTVALQPV